MRYKTLGPTGLRVSELCLGTMTFGNEWGWGADAETSADIFQAFVDAGGTFIDTANLYQNAESERILGSLIQDDRDRLVVATKYTLAMRDGDPNAGGSNRKSLMRELEGSLERLDTDWVDLLWVHAFDELTPIEETMRALDDVVRQGLVHYVGVSDWPAWAVAKANVYAEQRGLTPFCALQIEHSLIERTPERDLIPMARHFGLSITPWGPLGGGVLTGKYLDDGPGGRLSDKARQRSDGNLKIAREVVDIASDANLSPSQVAIAWLRSRGSDIIPILGASSVKHVQDNLGVLDVTLSDDALSRLDEVSAVSLGFPLEFLHGPAIRDRIYGGMRDQIDG